MPDAAFVVFVDVLCCDCWPANVDVGYLLANCSMSVNCLKKLTEKKGFV